MFEQTFIAPPDKTREAWTTAVSVTAQAALVACAILIPLLHPEAMPRNLLAGVLQAPAPPSPPRPLKELAVAVVSTIRQSALSQGRLFEPTSIPKEIKLIDDGEAAPAMSSSVGVPGSIGVPGAFGSAADSFARMVPDVAPPPPTPAPAAVKLPERKPVERIKVGGQVQEAMIVRRVLPVYPALARQARIQGTVRLIGIIATDGTIQHLQVVSGHPLLVNAAVDAVRQWIYRPTLLNGDPVEVVAPIDVNFTLGQ